MKRNFSLMRLLVFAALAAFAANAAVVTFNGMGSTTDIPFVSAGGLDFTRMGIGSIMYVWPPGSPNDNGTDALILGFNETAWVDITLTGGGVFNLNAFDMTISWYETAPTRLVDVTAYYLIGGPVTQTITLGQGLQTYALNLAGVTKVSVFGMQGANGYWLMDNVSYDQVPEPATWGTCAAGVAALALLRRRK